MTTRNAIGISGLRYIPKFCTSSFEHNQSLKHEESVINKTHKKLADYRYGFEY